MRALIVKDERRLAENIARSLRESAGYALDCCFDGEDGPYMVETNPYDLLVLDLMLPKLGGSLRCCAEWRGSQAIHQRRQCEMEGLVLDRSTAAAVALGVG